jgi:prophage DNA circulation protein
MFGNRPRKPAGLVALADDRGMNPEEPTMTTHDWSAWQAGYEAGIDDAIRLIDALRGPGAGSLSTPILLRIRAELLALRERAPQQRAA